MPLLRRALGLQYLTSGYNVAEGVIAILAGLAVSSISLVGFGLDSGIEVAASAIIVWRFRAELRGGRSTRAAELRATRMIAVTFFILSAYISIESVQSLAAAEIPTASLVGIALACASLIVMPILAIRKRRIAKELRSGAALSESTQTFACSILSGLLLFGLVANVLAGWWWADALAALIMVPFLLREGWRAWKGQLCCDDHEHGPGAQAGQRGKSVSSFPVALIAACILCGCSDCIDQCSHPSPDDCNCPHCKKAG